MTIRTGTVRASELKCPGSREYRMGRPTALKVTGSFWGLALLNSVKTKFELRVNGSIVSRMHWISLRF